ncbi:MAG: MCP four helix bundle domain-containing protein [Burkholderiaceae bacterium]|nr:MCP four helix bundle domain-containing protein [Burkholderiaceae bacterium]
MNTNNLKISTKLWTAVGFILIALTSILFFAVNKISINQGEMDSKLANLNLRLQITRKWYGILDANSSRVLAMVISDNKKIATVFSKPLSDGIAEINEIQKKIESMELSDAEKSQINKIGESRKRILNLLGILKKLRTDGKEEEISSLIDNQYMPVLNNYIQEMHDLVKIEENSVDIFTKNMHEDRDSTFKFIGFFVCLLISCIFIGAIFLIKSINTPMVQANNLAARIAQGDLSASIDTTRGDEFGDLMRSLEAMNNSLGRMVQQVRHSTDSIATASAEIATGNNDLAHRTEQTSTNLQSTASGMAELTAIVQHSSDHAHQASTLAVNASAVAEKGGQVVQQVVATMEEINASSKKINDIISVIDGIAFQTNILALNAAVEAARAGEQGRGFAVVASEVRSLAQRSAEAAKEIKTLISTSVEKVASGTELVSAAGSTMQDIVQSVRKVSDVISEITSASTAQTSGIAQVNQAIDDLDQMTQQNAALVEESAAAAESLRMQADQLVQAVAVFTINERRMIQSS